MKLIAFLLLGAIGLALIIIGLGGTTGWLLIVIGFSALLVALPAIWVIQTPERRRAARAARHVP